MFNQNQTQKCGDVIFHAFDPVRVRLNLDTRNVQHEKLVLKLVSPAIEGFSVPPLDEGENKRKSSQTQSGRSKKKNKK